MLSQTSTSVLWGAATLVTPTACVEPETSACEANFFSSLWSLPEIFLDLYSTSTALIYFISDQPFQRQPL
jgi:hypothetical protein